MMEKRFSNFFGRVEKLIIPIIVGLVICSCGRELEELNSGNRVSVAGESDTIGFSLSCFYSCCNTKSPVQVDETMIADINIYVVNEEGDVVDYKYCARYTAALELFIYKGSKHKIYVMANVGQVSSLRNSSEIESYCYSVSSIEGIANANGGIPMSGKSDMRLFGSGEKVKIMLVRAVAVFVVKCDYSGLNSGVTVNVKKIALKNAPSGVLLFSNTRNAAGTFMAGEERSAGELSHLESYGEGFLLFENMQGRVAPGAVDNKSKMAIMSADSKLRSSYIQMDYDYVSPQKRGSISYKFYIGSSYEDCDVARNTKYTCTVYFKGNASANENSESVDNSGLNDRVTAIEIAPDSYVFDEIGAIFTPSVEVKPLSSYNKELRWSSSNPLVATVDKFGSIKAISEGDCVITATSVENPDISSLCRISVMQPEIEFSEKNKVMYDGEETVLLWKKLIPNNMIPTVVSSDTQVLQILEVNSLGVKVRAKSRGNVAVTASKAKAKDICNIKVEELKITFNTISPLFFYTGFNDPVSYSVSPAHAELLHSQGKLRINWSSSDNNSLVHLYGNLFRGGMANSSADIIASFADYPAKKFMHNVFVKPAVSVLEENVNLVANSKVAAVSPYISDEIYVSYALNIDKHSRAVLKWSGTNVGVQRDNIHIDSQNKLSLDNQTAANGIYQLKCSITNADDGVSYYDQLSVAVYEAVKIWMVNSETNIGNVEDDPESVNIESSYTGETDQPDNRIGVFKCILTPAINREVLIDVKDTFLYYYDYSFVEHINYPCKVGEIVYVKIVTPFDKGLGGDKKYRFYYSADSL